MSRVMTVSTLKEFLNESNMETLENAIRKHKTYDMNDLCSHGKNCYADACSTCYAWEFLDYTNESVQDAWSVLRDEAGK